MPLNERDYLVLATVAPIDGTLNLQLQRAISGRILSGNPLPGDCANLAKLVGAYLAYRGWDAL